MWGGGVHIVFGLCHRYSAYKNNFPHWKYHFIILNHSRLKFSFLLCSAENDPCQGEDGKLSKVFTNSDTSEKCD